LDPSILILLAEDEPLIGLSLQTALEDGGYAVHHVYSGADALAALDRHDANVSGVITDIRLGIGPDGWDVARRARELNALVPIIYMSGDSAHEHSSKGVPDSVMLQKPFAPAQLVTAISSLLNEVKSQPG
jgi:DNA-binding response OmpR family regulator